MTDLTTGQQHAVDQLERWKRSPVVEVVLIRGGPHDGRKRWIAENEARMGFFALPSDVFSPTWAQWRDPITVMACYRDSGERIDGVRIFEREERG